jgi:hypothetical protein
MAVWLLSITFCSLCVININFKKGWFAWNQDNVSK